ncbi:3D-(3,5/4)-trihydroxycyclohexane-1,2-dione acylhydrolase (decyclizing) [Marinitoga hydrogenitolerans DSM 16785]|uniref:3D-(3,5/4)-trihydroxycyclohexane-1,2-dione acylhydrolase (Decyclizing) n=1 Tax=Marinitoga hydrogenitolerans (strain DSM 16785 / JCM 12826 / AT1271) TaxID=1122195 RepID=A0A1M4SI13_MARH1|nr:3D-(3,5/4)-trihydroxycyclohexane-1,2-dione acylhydrolase (decyclizing) [Marinitoga hydrogenitolerans]SHE31851.1 3D-(3,5/4)-trihydroxycyclohexane-1,2-dione acylhydrolase (decyclizing) [Marinitoga hydrogenitolerans DSM 16785]
MKKLKLTMAQALLKFLDNQYVEFDGKEYKFIKGIFGIFGHGNVLGIAEALENMKDLSLKFYQGHNEQGMVHAATAYAKQKNRLEIFACTSSIGPGALNMVTAAATATVNKIPVLLLPGDIFASRQPDPVLQQLEMPNNYKMVANDAFKSVSKYWDRIERPEQLMSAVINAMRVLTDPVETGAVTLALPQDVQGEVYEYTYDFFRKRVWIIERRTPNYESLKKAANLISNKKKPLIIAGGGVHYSFAYDELKEFAETFNIPIGFTQAGKGALVWDHPLNMGGIGTTGTLAANKLAKEADLIIAIGTRLMDFTTASKTQFQNKNVEFLNINISRFDGIKLDSTLLLSDAKLALKELKKELEKREYKSGYTQKYISSLKNKWNEEVNKLYSLNSKKGIVQTRALGLINELFNENDIIVGAAGSLPGDLHKLWRCKGIKTYHLEYGFSCMGYEVAGTYGVKLAEPKKEIWTMISDGSYIMLHSELVSSIQEGKKINIIMFDNGGFQSINSLQKGHGSEKGFGNELRYRNSKTDKLDGEYMKIDFAKNAESYGAKAFYVDTIEKLEDALKKARESEISTLIHIKIIPGTQSSGYETFWRVGIAHHSQNPKVIEKQKDHDEYLQKYAKDY